MELHKTCFQRADNWTKTATLNKFMYVRNIYIYIHGYHRPLTSINLI